MSTASQQPVLFALSAAAAAAACGACATTLTAAAAPTEMMVVAVAAAAVSVSAVIVDHQRFLSSSSSSSADSLCVAVSTNVVAASALWFMTRTSAAAGGHDSVLGFLRSDDTDAVAVAVAVAAAARTALAIIHAIASSPATDAAIPYSTFQYHQAGAYAPKFAVPLRPYYGSASATARTGVAVGAGYVPDGLSKDDYEKQKAKDLAKKTQAKSSWLNKKKKGFEDLTEWQKKRDAKFESKGRGLGHLMVKTKYKGPMEDDVPRGWFGEKITTREYKEGKGPKGKGKK